MRMRMSSSIILFSFPPFLPPLFFFDPIDSFNSYELYWRCVSRLEETKQNRGARAAHDIKTTRLMTVLVEGIHGRFRKHYEVVLLQ
jgi:hypothetical protein